MSALRRHVLLYDQDCPLCGLYTSAFLRRGWLDGEGRHPFQQTPEDWQQSVDMQRASNEIALLNRETGEVRYGIDALLTIVSNRHPGLAALADNRPARFLLLRLYRFVSYNRKVIAAVKPKTPGCECRPSFSWRYRVLYLLFAWLLTSLVLTSYAALLTGLIPPSTFGREFAICGGQIVFQTAVLLLLRRSKMMDYLGNMMTVSLIGAGLLLPLLGLSLLTAIPPHVCAVWFLVAVAFMLYEHSRRCRLLGLGLLPSATWVLYRLLILAMLLMNNQW